MAAIYPQEFPINGSCVDRYGKLKLSSLLFFAQEAAGRHFDRISMTYDQLAQQGMFWAIIRQRVQISRVPRRGETIRVETWPMPTTRVAYPRSVVAYDEAGNEVFRSISLWVLMDLENQIVTKRDFRVKLLFKSSLNSQVLLLLVHIVSLSFYII